MKNSQEICTKVKMYLHRVGGIEFLSLFLNFSPVVVHNNNNQSTALTNPLDSCVSRKLNTLLTA